MKEAAWQNKENELSIPEITDSQQPGPRVMFSHQRDRGSVQRAVCWERRRRRCESCRQESGAVFGEIPALLSISSGALLGAGFELMGVAVPEPGLPAAYPELLSDNKSRWHPDKPGTDQGCLQQC